MERFVCGRCLPQRVTEDCMPGPPTPWRAAGRPPLLPGLGLSLRPPTGNGCAGRSAFWSWTQSWPQAGACTGRWSLQMLLCDVFRKATRHSFFATGITVQPFPVWFAGRGDRSRTGLKTEPCCCPGQETLSDAVSHPPSRSGLLGLRWRSEGGPRPAATPARALQGLLAHRCHPNAKGSHQMRRLQ